jgi:hypothetical protein
VSLTPLQVAEDLGVCRKTVYSMLARGMSAKTAQIPDETMVGGGRFELPTNGLKVRCLGGKTFTIQGLISEG